MSYLDYLNNDLIYEICSYLPVIDSVNFIITIGSFDNKRIIKNIFNQLTNISYKCKICDKNYLSNDMAKKYGFCMIWTNICKYCYVKYKKCEMCENILVSNCIGKHFTPRIGEIYYDSHQGSIEQNMSYTINGEWCINCTHLVYKNNI